MSTSPNNHCLSLDEIRLYVSGALPAKEKRRVETHLLSCELCSDAVEGYTEHPFSAADLPPIPGQRSAFNWKVWSVAASVLIAVSAGIFFLSEKQSLVSSEDIAAPAQVNLPPVMKEEEPVVTEQSKNEKLNELFRQDKEVNTLMQEKVKKMEVSADFFAKKDTSAWSMPQHNMIVGNTTPGVSNEVKLKNTFTDTFLYDLKITQYEYYYANVEGSSGGTRSTEARFENTEDKLQRKEDGKDLEWITSEDVIRKAMENFSTGNYQSALKLYNVLIAYEPNDVNALFYASVCYKNLSRAGDAVEYLERVLNNPNRSFYEEAEWELAQCYVQTKDFKKAEETLEKIHKAGGFYAARSLDLLRKVRMKNKKP